MEKNTDGRMRGIISPVISVRDRNVCEDIHYPVDYQNVGEKFSQPTRLDVKYM